MFEIYPHGCHALTLTNAQKCWWVTMLKAEATTDEFHSPMPAFAQPDAAGLQPPSALASAADGQG